MSIYIERHYLLAYDTHPGPVLKRQFHFKKAIAIGAYTLRGIICLPMSLKLLANSQWKVDSDIHGIKLDTPP